MERTNRYPCKYEPNFFEKRGAIWTISESYIDPSAKIASERTETAREDLTTNGNIIGTPSPITNSDSAELGHYGTLKV